MFYEQIEDVKYLRTNTQPRTKVVDEVFDTVAKQESQIRIQIEKIPAGLNFIDLVKFKKLVTNSINGNISRVFTLREYLIYVYTVGDKKSTEGNVFLDKIDFLKTITKDKSECEVWVLKDSGYLCVGMFQSVPIFFKSFSSVFDVNNDVHMIIDNMRSYGMMSNIRFFCCNSNEFNHYGNLNIFEYSESFMSEIMHGNTSITQYCEDLRKFRTSKIQERFGIASISGSMMALCAIMFYACECLENCKRDIVERISIASRSGLPDWEHYQQIINLENSNKF